MTATAKEHLIGTERLVLTSGGGDNTRFFGQAVELGREALAHADIWSAADRQPNVLIDQSAAPNRNTFDTQRRELQLLFRQLADVQPDWVQPAYGVQPAGSTLASKLSEAHLLYVDNGNARHFKTAWPQPLRTVVTERVRAGVMAGAGSGAGALLWFATGHSNARKHEVAPAKRWNYGLIKGLGALPAWATTHWEEQDDLGRHRQERFEETLANHSKDWHVAVGLDSTAILICKGGLLTVLDALGDSTPRVHVYRDNPSYPRTYGPGEPFEL